MNSRMREPFGCLFDYSTVVIDYATLIVIVTVNPIAHVVSR